MWVIAARMHMDGKAKEWFEAYRLRQVVGDWPEFIDDVEAHFVVGALSPSTAILGDDHPCGVVHGIVDISPETPTRCSPLSPKEVTTTDAKPMKPTPFQLVESIKLQVVQLKLALTSEYEENKKRQLGTVTQMAEPVVDSHEEVLTHINGVSMFLELSAEPAGALFADTTLVDLANDVITCIGGLSLFLELDMDSDNGVFEDDVLTAVGGVSLFLNLDMDYIDQIFTCVRDCSIFMESGMGGPTEMLGAPSFQHVVCDEKIASHILSHVDGSSFLLNVSVCSGTDVLDAKLPRKHTYYSTWNFTMENEMLPWCRNGFSPGSYRWPSVNTLKLIDNYWVAMQLFTSSELTTRELGHCWHLRNWLGSLQFVTTDPFLSLEEIKGRGAHTSTYIQLALQ
jgi:hypothetical protein